MTYCILMVTIHSTWMTLIWCLWLCEKKRFFSLQPICSIHINLLYGAVYRVSPSERLFSSESAPGLVLALGELSMALASSDFISIYYVPFPLIMQWMIFSFSGVASTNLKIYPDVFMSLDGGLGWSRVSFNLHMFWQGWKKNSHIFIL